MRELFTSGLERYIDEYLRLWDFFGVIQVIKGGEVIFEKSSGYACLEFEIMNTMQTRFTLASISKQFTAFAVMILYDDGLLDVDGPANRYLPPAMKISDNITVHHLLSHTSGLYNFYNFENDFFGMEDRLLYSQSEFFSNYINKKPIQSPGVKFDYNNSNYNLLAWIIENVSGVNYDTFLKTHIFEPLDMQNSYVDEGEKIIFNRAFHYLKDFDKYIRCPYHNGKFDIGAGEVISNCGDLYKWYLCLKDKINIELINETLYFTRFKGSLHIELYPTSQDKFARRYSDQQTPYVFTFHENGQPQFFGYTKQI